MSSDELGEPLTLTDYPTAYHAGAAAIKAAASDPIAAAKATALLAGYDCRWARWAHRADVWSVESVEAIHRCELVNPETTAKSRTFTVAGKIDVIYTRTDGSRVIMDHKTTSQPIEDLDGPFWRQLAIEGQISHYMLLDRMNGGQCQHAEWDVVRKPMIAPKKLTKAERASVVADRKYFGHTVSDETLTALQTEERETPEMFQARLSDDCTYVRPEWYFQRRAIPRMDSELLEYASELWEHSQEIIAARRLKRHARNSGACMLYGTPCKFLAICSGYDSPDSEKWDRKENVHSELHGINGDGKNILTNSRIRCFQTCRRKHYYEYELGISRVNEEEREALVFGILWHLGLEAWWEFHRQRQG